MTSSLLAATRPKITQPALSLGRLDKPKALEQASSIVEPIVPEPTTQSRSKATVAEQTALRTRHTHNAAT